MGLILLLFCKSKPAVRWTQDGRTNSRIRESKAFSLRMKGGMWKQLWPLSQTPQAGTGAQPPGKEAGADPRVLCYI